MTCTGHGLLVACFVSFVACGSSAAAARGKLPGDDRLTTKQQTYEQHALTNTGDVSRGRRLFFAEQRTKCGICHQVEDRGARVGPDLTHIGGKFDRPHLIESLLDPSRQMVEGYRTRVVITTQGRVLTGVVKRQSKEGVELLDADGKSHSIPAPEIEQMQYSPVSLMPTGLAEVLSVDEFTDLIAYLESLRPAGKSSPGADVVGGIGLPRGFTIRTVATGLTGCTAMETTADGRVFICQQTGSLRVVKGGRLLDRALLTVPVDSTWERGLIGVTVAPGFPEQPDVFVCYVAKEPYPHHRVSRFMVEGDVADPGSEHVLLVGDDQRKLGGNVPAGHQGGALHFGPDGKLYIGIGEQTAETPAQELDTFQGKILRINPDGSIPEDNPFLATTSGKYRAIWAMGCRNPFTFAFQGPSGTMLINDVGGKYEEINRGRAGANYGWPAVDHGPTQDARFASPVYYYPQASIAGGDFAPDDLAWPARFHGRYFFADFVHGWIETLDPQRPGQVEDFVTSLRRPVDLRFAPGGSLYVLLRNAWVIDGKFQPGTGSLLRIEWTGSG